MFNITALFPRLAARVAPPPAAAAQPHPVPRQDEIQTLAWRLWQGAQAHALPIHVGRGWRVGSVISLPVTFDARVTVRALRRIEPELARWMQVAPVMVVQDPANGMVMIQTRSQKREVILAGPDSPKLAGARIPIGRLVNGRGDAIVDLSSPAMCHILIVAATGGGKTEALQTLMYQLCRQNDPQDLALMIIDPAGHRVSHAWDHSAHLLCPVLRGDMEQALHGLEWLADEVERRNREDWLNPRPRIVLAIDELADFSAGGSSARFAAVLERIVQYGRRVNVHAVCATQHASREFIGSAFIKTNFRARLVGKVDSASSSALATGEAGWDAHRLHGAGDFILAFREEGAGRFQCALTREDAILDLPQTRHVLDLPIMAPASASKTALAAQPAETAPAAATTAQRVQARTITTGDQQTQRMQGLRERMLAMLTENPDISSRRLEIALFGYAGGAATAAVARLRSQVETEIRAAHSAAENAKEDV
ncbi:MAG: FtsK/SpoIIIE domain-containing protein [Aggregatilineales bacterium]